MGSSCSGGYFLIKYGSYEFIFEEINEYRQHESNPQADTGGVSHHNILVYTTREQQADTGGVSPSQYISVHGREVKFRTKQHNNTKGVNPSQYYNVVGERGGIQNQAT